MSLETVYYIGQTIAVVIIIATLIAVLFQMRQANRLAKLETTRMIWSDAGAMLLEQVNDEEKANFIQRALFGGQEITRAEKTRLYLFLSSMFVYFENGYVMSKSGMMEDNFWPRMRASMKDYLRPARGKRWWSVASERTFAANADFAAEVDELLAELSNENEHVNP